MTLGRRDGMMFLGFVAAFALLYHLPVSEPRFRTAVLEALGLARWYAREHVLLCLIPAFFIAGAIGVWVRQAAVIRYLGPSAPKRVSYPVAAVAGTLLAVCSCTVLPLFGSIYYRGAGLGPAVAFLYSGPAINVMAIALTARVLGWPLGLARAVGAIAFSIVIGLLMHMIFRAEERQRVDGPQEMVAASEDGEVEPLHHTLILFAALVGILLAANWGRPADPSGFGFLIFRGKWLLTAVSATVLAVSLWRFFRVPGLRIVLAALPAFLAAVVWPRQPLPAFVAGTAGLVVVLSKGPDRLTGWLEQTWSFARQILPLLLAGVLAAGFFLGGPQSDDAGIMPGRWIRALLGDSPSTLWGLLGHAPETVPGWLSRGWPVWTNLFASVAGALMYFATLTEVPIVRGLLDSGMGQGPALALLLAGPALSLPNMLVIHSILGFRKTLAYILLVVLMATVSGWAFGVATSAGRL